MSDFEREKLRTRACRLSEVSNEEYKSALECYKKTVGRMWRIPEYFFDLGVVTGMGIAMFCSQFWLRLFGIVICLFGASQIGKRMGFQFGYVWGKQVGVSQGLGIPEGEDSELLKKTRELAAER